MSVCCQISQTFNRQALLVHRTIFSWVARDDHDLVIVVFVIAFAHLIPEIQRVNV